MVSWRGHGTSGAGGSWGSFSSLSLELLSLSESEELSESLVLSDSAPLECAEAAASGSDCGALQSNQKRSSEDTTQGGFFPSLFISCFAHFSASQKKILQYYQTLLNYCIIQLTERTIKAQKSTKKKNPLK